LGPHKYISSDEGKVISTGSRTLYKMGIKNIVKSKMGTKLAEYRNI